MVVIKWPRNDPKTGLIKSVIFRIEGKKIVEIAGEPPNGWQESLMLLVWLGTWFDRWPRAFPRTRSTYKEDIHIGA